jgi:hypothetical protein
MGHRGEGSRVLYELSSEHRYAQCHACALALPYRKNHALLPGEAQRNRLTGIGAEKVRSCQKLGLKKYRQARTVDGR